MRLVFAVTARICRHGFVYQIAYQGHFIHVGKMEKTKILYGRSVTLLHLGSTRRLRCLLPPTPSLSEMRIFAYFNKTWAFGGGIRQLCPFSTLLFCFSRLCHQQHTEATSTRLLSWASFVSLTFSPSCHNGSRRFELCNRGRTDQ